MDKRNEKLKEVPERVFDRRQNITYLRGKFLGKGGFARCYELTNSSTNELFAGKIISKTLLTKAYQREKMAQEVEIHRRLNHPNVVRLFTCFDDDDNVYITLELCSRYSLMELHKRRKIVTEPEARYFLQHVCNGLDYLHGMKIVHRDLKLGNLFINGQMILKLGDFGLATVVDDGERRKTLCGTPNYIAPEVLEKKGHSFEVDIWAVGCILYTLLFGRPPFETKTLKDTYERIRLNEYRIPTQSSPSVSQFISRLLAADPKQRPSIKQVMQHSFLTGGFIPNRLPVSCLTMSPKFNRDDINDFNSPARVRNGGENGRRILRQSQIVRQDLVAGDKRKPPSPQRQNQENEDNGNRVSDHPTDFYLSELQKQLEKVCASRVTQRALTRDNDEAPECTPIFWVSKWIDYSDKYGLGYELCDNSTGVLFNDKTRMILDDAGNELTYMERKDAENYYTIQKYPQELQKKVTILKHFLKHMNHLVRTGGDVAKKDGDDLARLPVLRNWFRNANAIVLHLSNGTLQINYFRDHTKLIICPLLSAVTYIDQQQTFHVYELRHLVKNGCPPALFNRLNYAKLMVERLIANENTKIGNQ